MLLASDLFTRDGLGQFVFRWLHIVAGITWIGLLYFFNVVQVPAYAEFEQPPNESTGGRARLIAIDKVTRRALWWFRWAAVGTFLTGILDRRPDQGVLQPAPQGGATRRSSPGCCSARSCCSTCGA